MSSKFLEEKVALSFAEQSKFNHKIMEIVKELVKSLRTLEQKVSELEKQVEQLTYGWEDDAE